MGDNAGWDPEHIFAKNVNLIAPSFLPNPSRSFTHKLKGALDSLFLVSTLIYSGVCQEFMDFFFFLNSGIFLKRLRIPGVTKNYLVLIPFKFNTLARPKEKLDLISFKKILMISKKNS